MSLLSNVAMSTLLYILSKTFRYFWSYNFERLIIFPKRAFADSRPGKVLKICYCCISVNLTPYLFNKLTNYSKKT